MRKYYNSLLFVVLSVAGILFSHESNAQNILWEFAPRINNPVLSGGDNSKILYWDTAYVEVAFKVQTAGTGMTLTLTPPAGLTMVPSVPIVGPGNTITLSDTLKPGVAYPLGNMSTSDLLYLRVPVTAQTCGMAAGQNLRVQLGNSANANAGDGARKDIALLFEYPEINVTIPEKKADNTDNAIINYTTAGETHAFLMNVNSPYGVVNDFRLSFTVEGNQAHLDNFALNGFPVPAGQISRSWSSPDSVYTVSFPKDFLESAGVGKLGTAPVEVTFDATTKTGCGVKMIHIGAWMPVSSASQNTACKEMVAVPYLTMQMREVSVPTLVNIAGGNYGSYESKYYLRYYNLAFTYNGINYTRHDAYNGHFNSTSDLSGGVINYYYAAYRNNQNAGDSAYITDMIIDMGTNNGDMRPYRGTPWLDTNHLYYTIGYNGPLKKIRIDSVYFTYGSFGSNLGRGFVGNSYNDSLKDKPVFLHASVPEGIPALDTIFFLIGHRIGVLYDSNSFSTNATGSYLVQTRIRDLQVQNQCQSIAPTPRNANVNRKTPNLASAPSNFTTRAGRSDVAKISGARTGDVMQSYNIPARAGQEQRMRVYVQWPSWMSADPSADPNGNGEPLQWIIPNNPTTRWAPVASYAVGSDTWCIELSSNDNAYTGWEVSRFSSGELVFYYTVSPTACPSTATVRDSLTWWIDYYTNGPNAPTAARPVMRKIGYVKQPVDLLCQEEGFVIDNFFLVRHNQGWKDSDGNGIIDIPRAPADSAAIDHGFYMLGDTGHMTIRGHMAGNGYTWLYFPITMSNSQEATLYFSTNGTNYHLKLLSDQATITINGVEQPGALTHGNPVATGGTQRISTFWLGYDASGHTALQDDDIIEVTLPYTVIAAVSNATHTNTLKAEGYAATAAQGNPMNPAAANRFGNDYMTTPLRMRPYEIYYSRWDRVFNDNNAIWFSINRFQMLYTNISQPYFGKEIREITKFDDYKVWLPDGYEFMSDSARVYFAIFADNAQQTTPGDYYIHAREMGENYAYFNLSDIIKYDWDGLESTTNATGSGFGSTRQYVIPNERFYLELQFYVRATKGATPGVTMVKDSTYSVDARTGQRLPLTANNNQGLRSSAYGESPWTYNGLTSSLTLNTNEVGNWIRTETDVLEIPVVNVTNPNTSNMYNTWLYIEGPVANANFLNNTPGVAGYGQNTPGNGFEGRWIKIADTLTPNEQVMGTLTFTYSGNLCEDTMRVWIVSGYNHQVRTAAGDHTDYWNPTMDRPYEKLTTGLASSVTTAAMLNELYKLDWQHEGDKERVYIRAISSSVNGNLNLSNKNTSVPAGMVKFGENQILRGELNSGTYVGAVRAKMTVTVPAGQSYVPGSAMIAYPTDASPVPVDPSFEAYLCDTLDLDNDALSVSPRTFTWSMGAAVDGDTTRSLSGIGRTEEQGCILTMEFAPDCKTPLTGIQYQGILNGTSTCGATAYGDGKQVYTNFQVPIISAPYNFQVETEYANNGSSVVSPNDLYLPLRMVVRQTAGSTPVNASDGFAMEMHKAFSIDAGAFAENYGTAFDITKDSLSGNTRFVRVSFPVDYFNQNVTSWDSVVYDITLKFDTLQYDITAGASSPIRAYVRSWQGFDGSCNPNWSALGLSESAAAVVLLDPLPAIFCANSLASAEVSNAAIYNYEDYLYNWRSSKDENSSTNLLAAGASVQFATGSNNRDTVYVQVTDNVIGAYVHRGWVTYPYVNSLMEADFTLPDDTLCQDDPALFTDATAFDTISGDYVTNWEWFAPATTDSLILHGSAGQSLAFDSAGTQGIRLVATSALGCLDTAAKTIHVRGYFNLASCPADLNIMLPGGICDTAPYLGVPDIEYWAAGDTAFRDGNLQVSNDSPGIFDRGVDNVTWSVVDNRCPSHGIQTCLQEVVVNMPLCGENDTLWQPGGSFTINTGMLEATDADGNHYGTVRIGCDCWTKENLHTTSYDAGAGGGSVPFREYASPQHPDDAANSAAFGYLYTYDAASKNGTSAQGICPDGWKLPGQREFGNLTGRYASGELRQPGGDYWLGDPAASNSSGFSALPAGYYDASAGTCYKLLGDTWFWIESTGTQSLGKACHLFFGCPEILIEDFAKGNGASVRCVRVD